MPSLGQGRLIVENGEGAGTVYALVRPVTTIGRDEGNDIVSEDAFVSREHAEVRWDGTGYSIHDLASRNGTLLNGERLEDSQRLRHGDRLTVGARTFLFTLTSDTLSMPQLQALTGGVRVDRATAEVWVAHTKVTVTAKEFLALALLADKTGALVTKDELAVQVWPEYQGTVSDYNLEQLVSRLRRKLEPDPAHPRYLITVRGLGYRLLFIRMITRFGSPGERVHFAVPAAAA